MKLVLEILRLAIGQKKGKPQSLPSQDGAGGKFPTGLKSRAKKKKAGFLRPAFFADIT